VDAYTDAHLDPNGHPYAGTADAHLHAHAHGQSYAVSNANGYSRTHRDARSLGDADADADVDAYADSHRPSRIGNRPVFYGRYSVIRRLR
jgi:hypothetical protein